MPNSRSSLNLNPVTPGFRGAAATTINHQPRHAAAPVEADVYAH